jgi:hypothetical protein
MNKTFTSTDLILFAYNETELTETVLIVNAIERDPALHEDFEEIVNTINYIELLSLQPSSNSIEAILKHSRSGAIN